VAIIELVITLFTFGMLISGKDSNMCGDEGMAYTIAVGDRRDPYETYLCRDGEGQKVATASVCLWFIASCVNCTVHFCHKKGSGQRAQKIDSAPKMSPKPIKPLMITSSSSVEREIDKAPNDDASETSNQASDDDSQSLTYNKFTRL
jgi:hypothetical protein